MASKKEKYYKRPDGLYEAIRIVGGKRKAFRGHTPKEVEQKMIAYAGEVERGRPFRTIAEEWEGIHFPTLAPNSLKNYKPAYKRAVDEFKDTSIREIKAPDIKRFISAFARGGRAQKTVSTQLLILSLIFGYAAEGGDIEYNPCINVSIPKDLPKSRREAASPEDEEKVKQSADIWLFPFLVLYTGLRKGEALALTYGDIDRKSREIAVTKSVYHVGNKPFIKSPKTAAGVRTVPILNPLLSKLPKSKNESLYLFSDDGGEIPLTHMRYQKLWGDYVQKAGISATAHQLRHSFATMLFENGIDVKDAQDILGHATAAMTQDIYTHVRDSHRKDIAALLNKRMNTTQKIHT